MENVYFLTVEQARALAKEHENEENWDIWEELECHNTTT